MLQKIADYKIGAQTMDWIIHAATKSSWDKIDYEKLHNQLHHKLCTVDSMAVLITGKKHIFTMDTEPGI